MSINIPFGSIPFSTVDTPPFAIHKHQQAMRAGGLVYAKSMMEKLDDFNPDSMARESELGELNFNAVVQLASNTQSLFRQLPPAILPELSPAALRSIGDCASACLNAFKSAADFQLGQRPKSIADVSWVRILGEVSLPTGEKTALKYTTGGELVNVEARVRINMGGQKFQDAVWQGIAEGKIDPLMDEHEHMRIIYDIQGACDGAFQAVAPLISYGVAAKTDLPALVREVGGHAAKAKHLLAQIRETAGQQGVFLQASHFKDEADKHWWASILWGLLVVLAVGALGCYPFVIAELFPVDLAALSGLSDTAERFVFLTGMLSRMLVFFVLSFLLFFCMKNYLAHRHNTVVNRHRQKALETYRALVDGVNVPENADIVLAHAARCIYAPQDTGFMRSNVPEGQTGPLEIFRAGSAGARAAKTIKEDS